MNRACIALASSAALILIAFAPVNSTAAAAATAATAAPRTNTHLRTNTHRRTATASGTTLTWSGTSSANWSDAANWSPADVPANGDSLVFQMDDPDIVYAPDNDMSGLVLDSISFTNSGEGGCSGPLGVSGNGVTVTGSITSQLWCYNAPPTDLGIPITLAAGTVSADDIAFDDAVSGPGGLEVNGPVELESNNSYAGGTTFVDSGSYAPLLVLQDATGVELPASSQPIDVPLNGRIIDLSGEIAPSDKVEIEQGGSFTTTLPSSAAAFKSFYSDGVLYLNGSLNVGQFSLGPDSTVYLFAGDGYEHVSEESANLPEIDASSSALLNGSLSTASAGYTSNPPETEFPGAIMLLERSGSATPLTGEFTGLAEGAAVPMPDGDTPASYAITYKAGPGGDVALTSDDTDGTAITVAIDDEAGGSGTVTSSPSGIDCPSTSAAPFPAGTVVTLTYMAAAGSSISTSSVLGTTPCDSTPAAGTYSSITCKMTVNGQTFVGLTFSGVAVSLGPPFSGPDSSNQALVGVAVSACESTGVSDYAYKVDGTAVSSQGCEFEDELSVGSHTVSLVATSTDGTRSASTSATVVVSPLAQFSWQVAPISYGSSTSTTTVTFSACNSAGVESYTWELKGSGIPDKKTTSCQYKVTLPTGKAFDTTLTVRAPNGETVSTSADVAVNSVLLQPTSQCSNVSIGANACWRRGLDWFGDAFGVSGNAMRAPDYAVLAVSGSAFGVTGIVNVAMTCDGNLYYGIGGGFGIGFDTGIDVSAVLAFGYVGDPDTVAPSEQDIDSFVSGETESVSISSVGAGFSYVHSPEADGPTVGVEYFGGFTLPSLTFSASYDWGAPWNAPPSSSATCDDGVTANPIWQQLMNFQPGTPGAGNGYNPLSGSSPTAGQGASINVDVPSGTFADGGSVQVGVHSSKLIQHQTAASDEGAIGTKFKLPKGLAVGVHHLIIEGIAPDGAVKTYIMTMPVKTRLAGHGYWLANSKGTVAAGGVAKRYNGKSLPKGATVTALAPSARGKGYWLATTTGTVVAYGDARLEKARTSGGVAGRVIGMSATPDGKGYWLTTSSGKVYAYGDAKTFRPHKGSHPPTKDVVGMSPTPDGAGYWLVTSSGAVTAFGDAATFTAKHARHAIALVPTIDGRGYYILESSGKVVAVGDAKRWKAVSGTTSTTGKAIGLAVTPDGKGYWIARSSGPIERFGDAKAIAPAASASGAVSIFSGM